MKICKKTVLFTLALVIFVSFFSLAKINVYSDNTYEILSKKTGSVDYKKSKTFSFNVPTESKVTVKFIAFDDISGTYGGYHLEIIDSKNKVIFKKDDSICFVDRNISVTLKKGNYKLKLKEPGNYIFDYVFYVVGTPTADKKAQSIKLNKSNTQMKMSDTLKLQATVSPKYLSKDIKWSTSNKNVAAVDNTGQITAKNLGTAKIIATKDKKSAYCNVVVKKADVQRIIHKTSTSLSKFIKYVENNKKAKWSSSNTKIATVDSKGTLTAKGTGKCNITCKIGNQKYTIPVNSVIMVEAKPGAVEDRRTYNNAWVEFTNNSNKNIVYISLDIKQYDNKGSKLKSPYTDYYLRDKIKANSKKRFVFAVNDNTKKTEAKIIKVQFSDGSTWKP